MHKRSLLEATFLALHARRRCDVLDNKGYYLWNSGVKTGTKSTLADFIVVPDEWLDRTVLHATLNIVLLLA